MQETVSSAGGSASTATLMSASTILGLPASGEATNGIFIVMGDIGTSGPPPSKPITTTVTITGTLDDPSATLTVNNTPAVITGNTFTVANVALIAGPNTLTAVAVDAAGNRMSKAMTVYLDLPQAQKTPRGPTTVQGTINDPTARVTVNGVAATVASGTFTVSVPMVTGLNTLAATATDAAGNTTMKSIRVFVSRPTTPPAMPTVGTVGTPPPAVTTQSSLTIGGTKTAGTSIWINGQQVYPNDNSTTWTATVTLVEGDNALEIVAKDATGAASAATHTNVILDTLAPILTVAPSAKTNLNPYTLQGSVDDSLTTVTINGLSATRAQRAFTVSVPLTLGSNLLHLTAVSPNGYTTTRDFTITLGTIPTLQTIQPVDGRKLYAGTSTSLQATATDKENDPMQYQFLIDGTPLGLWGGGASQTWTPSVSQLGLHTVTVNVRDDYGGSNTQAVDVDVIRSPIQHP